MKNKLFILISGTGAGQFVQLLCLPFITRYYSSEIIGSYGSTLASAALLSVLIGMKMEVDYIKTPESNKNDITATFFITSLIVSAVALIILQMGFLDIYIYPGRSDVFFEDHLWFVFIALTLSLFEYNAVLLSARSKIKSLALIRAVRGGGTGICQAAFGFIGLNHLFVLIISDAFFRLLSSGPSFIQIFRGKFDIGYIFVKQRVSLIGAAFLSKLSLNMPYILIAYIWGASHVGFYFITQRTLGSVMALLGKSISNVYISEVSEDISKGRYRAVQDKTQRIVVKSFSYSLPFFLVSGIVGYFYLGPVFGSQWATFDKAWLCIVLLYFFRFSFSPISQTLNYISRSNVQITWELGRACLMFFVLFMPNIIDISFEIYLLSFSLAAGCSYFFLYIIIQRQLIVKA